MMGVVKIHWKDRPDALKIMEDLFPDHTAKEIGDMLGVGPGCIYQQAIRMGLKKSEAFKLRYPQAENKKGQKEIEHPAPGITIHRLI